MFAKASGQPFIGSVTLTPAAPGPVSIPIKTTAGGATYTLASNERVVITNITLSTNDSALPLITLDDGAPSPRMITRAYTGPPLPAIQECNLPGVCQGYAGTLPRATSTPITAAKTVEVVIRGYVTLTV